MNARERSSTPTSAIARELRDALRGDVDFSISARALFASDASNYRIVPLGVVFPRSDGDVLATLEIARAHGVSIVSRGGGTSTGGQTVNEGIVVDYSRYLDRVLEIDETSATARVQPGVVLDELQRACAPSGFRFGPDPSTHDRCTIGGMIGNNACGAHSMRWGKTDENVIAMRVATFGGEVLQCSTLDALAGDRSPFAQGLHHSLKAFVERYGDAIRTQMGPPMPRRVSGYGLGHLLPEHGGHLARALVGTEGTCVALLDATLRLVRPPESRVLVILGFQDLYAAADFVPVLLGHEPLTIEGLDARLVELARHTNESSGGAALLPDGNGWLLLEVGGGNPLEALANAEDLVRAIGGNAGGPSSRIVHEPTNQRAVWRLREDGAGLATRLPDGSEAWPGWEDAAVPPERLGDYLRGFDALLAQHGRQGMHYGHYGEGCMHIRIDFDFLSEHGRAEFRAFIEDAADLVVAFGGSLSGEHGDGQARSELLHKMYPPVILDAFRAFKEMFDPTHQMNPGRIVAARPLDRDLRVRIPVRAINGDPHLAIRHDAGDLERSARRCVGVGKCRRLDGGAMCPSFQVTRDERDSTRGRARMLSEMFAGDLVVDGWRSREVLESLDLCLSCKACASDCPVGVDMAAYKSEFLSHYYEGRLRPRAHYALGNLPRIARRLRPVVALVNRLFASPLSPMLKWIGGIDQRRVLPQLARRPLVEALGNDSPKATVVLFPDTFTNFFEPEVGIAAKAVLEALGARVVVPREEVCCGLTWYSTGQIDRARRAVAETVAVLDRLGALPIVVLEPSCASMLRDEIADLLPDHEAASSVAQRVVSFGSFVAARIEESGTHPFDRQEISYLAQVHCHQRATTGYEDERRLLEALGVHGVALEEQCCGLAGNFGFEAGHFAISKAIAERSIVAKVATAMNDSATAHTVVADGFSCRTQIRELTDARPRHLAEVLRDALCSA